MGQSYTLGCPEGGEPQLRDAVERVDTAMTKIRDAGKVRARDRIAVLAALNLAFELIQQPTAQPASAARGASPAAADSGESDDPRIAQLLQRLDQTLAGDGHLL